MTPALPRRQVLVGTALTLPTALGIGARSDAGPAPAPTPRGSRRFRHGVASGDPRHDRVLLWTRLTPPTSETRSTVTWEVATDSRLRHVVRRGRFVTGRDRDHTVKLQATGLEPATWYYYRFTHDGHHSRVGRTRTAPAPHVMPGHLRIGFVSCANYQAGYFAAYRHLAERNDLHAIVHLGDYFYESGLSEENDVRKHVPETEVLTLDDYRQRHAQYKLDPDLQDLHAAYPMIATWDDHEVSNDQWSGGAGGHDRGEGSWRSRRAQAHRAYDEWMPAALDGTARLDDGDRIFRSLPFGRLFDLHMLDLRSYRDEQVANMFEPGAVDDPDRTITGQPQLDWLKRRLSSSNARWQLVGNSVMIAPLSVGGLPAPIADALSVGLQGAVSANGVPLNPDAWDGYTDDRRELFSHIRRHDIENVVFLTGDIHTGLAADLPLDKASYPLGETAGVELVCASITSGNFDEELGTRPHTSSEVIAAALVASNPHYKYVNLDDHGYCVLDVTPERVQCDWWIVGDRRRRDTGIRHDGSVMVRRGEGRLRSVSDPV